MPALYSIRYQLGDTEYKINLFNVLHCVNNLYDYAGVDVFGSVRYNISIEAIELSFEGICWV